MKKTTVGKRQGRPSVRSVRVLSLEDVPELATTVRVHSDASAHG